MASKILLACLAPALAELGTAQPHFVSLFIDFVLRKATADFPPHSLQISLKKHFTNNHSNISSNCWPCITYLMIKSPQLVFWLLLIMMRRREMMRMMGRMINRRWLVNGVEVCIDSLSPPARIWSGKYQASSEETEMDPEHQLFGWIAFWLLIFIIISWFSAFVRLVQSKRGLKKITGNKGFFTQGGQTNRFGPKRL